VGEADVAGGADEDAALAHLGAEEGEEDLGEINLEEVAEEVEEDQRGRNA
jgi:hypothetical protein